MRGEAVAAGPFGSKVKMGEARDAPAGFGA